MDQNNDRANTDLCALKRMRYSVNSEQPVAVLESTETTSDTSDSADELYTPVEVENHTCTTPRKKRKVMEHMYNNASKPKEYTSWFGAVFKR